MCRAEAPHLSRLQEKYKDQGLTVLGVNADNNSKENLNRFIQEKKLTHAILLNGSGVAMQTYSARAYPTTYWINDPESWWRGSTAITIPRSSRGPLRSS